MKIVLSILLLLLAAVGWWHFAFPSYAHRYRVELEVEADGEMHQGSSVVEIVCHRQPQFGSAPPWRSEVRGQAALVDLGQRGALLAALNSGDPYEGGRANTLALRAFAGSTPELPPLRWPRDPGYPLTGAALSALPRLAGQRVDLPPFAMPPLVWLADPADPATARPVHPDDLASATGLGVRLRGAWIEVTRDPVTTDLFARFPWLAARYRAERDHGIRGRPDDKYRLFAVWLSQGVDP